MKNILVTVSLVALLVGCGGSSSGGEDQSNQGIKTPSSHQIETPPVPEIGGN